jgi:hypothetical protein
VLPKNKTEKRAGGVAKVVQCLSIKPSKCEALNSSIELMA